MNRTIFYQEKPVFGLDIGSDSLRAMQITTHGDKSRVTGYGVVSFDAKAINDGIIVDHEIIAKAANEMFKKSLVGDITTDRAVLSVPATKTFTRTFTIPKVGQKDLHDAVRLEIEQYVPVGLDSLYYDHVVLKTIGKEMEVLSVAIPKKIVDSYMDLARILGLEIIAVEPTTGASGRLFIQAERSDVPTVLIDLGSISSDITIYDETLVVTGTVPGGGYSFTQAIAGKLSLSEQEAHVVKTKYGLGLSKKQTEITEALDLILSDMVKEIRRMVRYYEERSGSDKQIDQIITMGGGANMPGLSEHLTNVLRIPVRMCDPWSHLEFKGIEPPNSVEKSMYVTVAGLAMLGSKEVFA